MAEAGYPNGFDIVLDSPDGRYAKDRELAEAMAGQLAQVGIRTTVKLDEWGVHTRRAFSHRTSPLYLYGWADSKADPESHDRFVLRSNGTWAQFHDAKLDALVDAIDTEMDRDKRKKLIYDLQDYQREIFPVTYILQMGIHLRHFAQTRLVAAARRRESLDVSERAITNAWTCGGSCPGDGRCLRLSAEKSDFWSGCIHGTLGSSKSWSGQ